jgi:hypothetical protein
MPPGAAALAPVAAGEAAPEALAVSGLVFFGFFLKSPFMEPSVL